MKPILALIIFADGAAAFIGGILASRIHTQEGKRPAIVRLLMIILFGYSAARFWQAWNTAAHGQQVIECVALQSPAYLWHSYGALTLQAMMPWGATIYLAFMLMNGRSQWILKVFERGIAVFKKKRPDNG